MEKLLCKTEVCEALGISRATLDRIVASGELEAIRIRGQVRFSHNDIQLYLAHCREPKAAKTKAATAARKEPGKPGRPKGSRKKTEEVYYPGMRVV